MSLSSDSARGGARFFEGMGFIASARTRRDPRANDARRVCSASRALVVIASAAPPSAVSAEAHRSRTCSGAPLVNMMACPLRVASTLIILRSRENSRDATRRNWASQYDAQYVARSAGRSLASEAGSASAPGKPTFSASARSAASVLSPTFSKRRVLSSYASAASLHSDAQMARCSVAAFSAGRATTPDETPARTSPTGE